MVRALHCTIRLGRPGGLFFVAADNWVLSLAVAAIMDQALAAQAEPDSDDSASVAESPSPFLYKQHGDGRMTCWCCHKDSSQHHLSFVPSIKKNICVAHIT